MRRIQNIHGGYYDADELPTPADLAETIEKNWPRVCARIDALDRHATIEVPTESEDS
jgi:hypothetical protein